MGRSQLVYAVDNTFAGGRFRDLLSHPYDPAERPLVAEPGGRSPPANGPAAAEEWAMTRRPIDVNRSAKPTSRDRNRSGSGAPDEPGKR